VLAGAADFIGTDPTWVRLAYVLFAVVVGFGPAIVMYIIAEIIVPKEPEVPAEIVVERAATSVPPAAPPSAPTPGTTAPPAPPVPPIPGSENRQ
jgi:phage shock protein PspC (stress-responsive transcriptional regulator)